MTVRATVVWPSVFAAVVLAVLFFGLPGHLAAPAVLAMALLAVRAFVTRTEVRGPLSGFAGLLGAWVALVTMFVGTPHVSLSSRSPDSRIWAELYETTRSFDRHFQVRLTKYWLNIIPIRHVVYNSPDEGPRGGERLVWSKDGRYVLLLGPTLFGTHNACLSSGDVLYLLVNAQTLETASNASQTGPRYRRFSLNEIAALGFDINVAPGRWDDRKHRCER
jgi:hypothetical protein